MSRVAHVKAQAKINVFLRILAREASGYHALETLFARLELGDEITVRVDGVTRSVDCHGADVGPPETNLAYRAAVAYAEATGWPQGFAIEIEKRIPVGGGLGGGSADAGAVLRALNALSPAPLPGRNLLRLAGRLGADVPFLTGESSLALAWGRGDRMLTLPALPPREVALVCFPFGISSAAAFGWVAESRQRAPSTSRPRRYSLRDFASWDQAFALAGNDFEDLIGGLQPPIADLLEGARAAGIPARLTGSGSTVVVYPRPGAAIERLPLPDGASLVRTRTAVSVEDVRVTG